MMEKMLNTRELAELTGLSTAWFERARWLGEGHGPKFHKIKHSVRYSVADIKEWLSQNRTESKRK